MDALNIAVDEAGGVSALATLIGVGQSVVSNWRSRKSVSADFCPSVERATKGKVACESLRPDVRWHRVADEAWPWHPEGRPLIDVAAAASTPAQAAA